MDKQSPFTVHQLRPQRIGGGGAAETYDLNLNSTSPIMHIGRDEYGRPVEETVPTVYSRRFVSLDGCIVNVPMRTASVFSMEPEAEKYELQTERELVAAGVFPVEACPYDTGFRHITGGTLVAVPDGEEGCDGSKELIRNKLGQAISGGCKHMQTLIEKRRARAHEEWLKIQNENGTLTERQAAQLLRVHAEAFEIGSRADKPVTGGAKQRLRDGTPDRGAGEKQ